MKSLEEESYSNYSRLFKIRLSLVHKLLFFLRKHPFKGSTRLKNLIKQIFIPSPPESIVVPTLYGFDLLIQPAKDNGVETLIYERGTYEDGTLSVMRSCLNKGEVFLDIGSNVGLMTMFASRLVKDSGKVYSFEPDPTLMAILKENKSINGFENVNTYQKALGSNSGKSTLYRKPEVNRGAGSLIKGKTKHTNEVDVEVKTLDDFITENQVPNIKMVKIDVEGWELEVLKGGNKCFSGPKAPILSVEFSASHPQKGGELLDLYHHIRNLNDYRIFKLSRGKGIESKLLEVKDEEDLPEHDNLFCFLPHQLSNSEIQKILKRTP